MKYLLFIALVAFVACLAESKLKVAVADNDEPVKFEKGLEYKENKETKKLLKKAKEAAKKKAKKAKKAAKKIAKKAKKAAKKMAKKPSSKKMDPAYKKCNVKVLAQREMDYKIVAAKTSAQIKLLKRQLFAATRALTFSNQKYQEHLKITNGIFNYAKNCYHVIVARLRSMYGQCMMHTKLVKKYKAQVCQVPENTINDLWKDYIYQQKQLGVSTWLHKAVRSRVHFQREAVQKYKAALNKPNCYAYCYHITATTQRKSNKVKSCFRRCDWRHRVPKNRQIQLRRWINRISRCEKNHSYLLTRAIKCIPYAIKHFDCPKTRTAVHIVKQWSRVTSWPF